MSRIIWPGIAATCIALYFFSRRRKAESEHELEPVESEPEHDTTSEAEIVAPAA